MKKGISIKKYWLRCY